MSKSVFQHYIHMYNSYQHKVVDSYIKHGFNTVQWCATEKVHGSNVSFILLAADPSNITCASRSQVLNGDQAEQNFFQIGNIKKQYATAFQKLLELTNAQHSIQVFGELYGGFAPKFKYSIEPDKRDKPVQKGIVYHPYHRFVIFDICVDGEYIPYTSVIDVCRDTNIPYLPIKHQGTLDELLSINAEFVSTLTSDLSEIGFSASHHPDDETEEKVIMNYLNSFSSSSSQSEHEPRNNNNNNNNIAEGYVLKPIVTLRTGGGERVMLKHKCKKFMEGCAQSQPKRAPLSDQEKNMIEDARTLLITYVNENRLQSVCSKFSNEVDRTNKAKIIPALIKDVSTDLETEQDHIQVQHPEVIKLIKQACAEFALKVL